MIAYRMLYAVAVGLPVLAGVYLLAATLRRNGRAERGVWVAGLVLAVALPGVLLTQPPPLGSPAAPAADRRVAAAAEPSAEGPALRLPTFVVVSRDAGFGVDEALLLAWLFASGGLVARWLVSTRRLHRLTASWSTADIDGTDVWVTSDSGPAVTGLLRAHILVPDWLLALPERQRSLVLLHEREHVRARDPWLMGLCRVARILTPWNPVVWVLSSRLLRAVEMDCDRRVLRQRPDVRTYCDTLFAISARQPSRLVDAAAFAEPLVPLNERIVSMTTPPRSLSTLGTFALLGLGALLAFGSCGVPMPTDGALDARQSAVDDVDPPNWVTIELSAEGEVTVDGESAAMEEVSAVVADRAEAATEPLVTRLRADASVPYRYLEALQQEVVEGGVVRVVFHVTDGGDAGELGIVLPEYGARRTVSGRNVLHFEIQPSGAVDVRRGESAQVQRVAADDIEGLWRQEVGRNPELIASVRFRGDATYRQFVDVLEGLQAANAQRIALAGVATQ